MDNNGKLLTVLVLGDNPDEIMKKYNKNLKVEPYIKYSYSDVKKIKQNNINVIKEIIKNAERFNLSEFHQDFLIEKIKNIEKLSDAVFFEQITDGLKIDKDGNAWDDLNPDGKWEEYHLGHDNSTPFILLDGNISYQAKIKEIDWYQTTKNEIYSTTWDIIMSNKKPKTKDEITIFSNKDKLENILKQFSNKQEYVKYNTAFWCYAYADNNRWADIDDNKIDSYAWVLNFYDNFIAQTNQDSLITIFEYK